MKFKISVLAALLAVVFPFSVKAQEVKAQEVKTQDLNISCESGAQCDAFDVTFSEEGEEIAQTRRTRTRRTRRSGRDSTIYVGGSLAPFIPFDGELDIGFGGGIFAGYKLTNNISVELDVFDYFGGLDDDTGFVTSDGEVTSGEDSGYNTFGAAISGVYRYHLNPNNSRSPYIFAGLGGGIGVVTFTGDLGDALDDADDDTSDTGFLIQGKGGVGYPLTDRINLFGQTRFFNTFTDGDDVDGVALDFGGIFNF